MGRYNNGGGYNRRYSQMDDENSATEKPKVEIIPPAPRSAKLREELLSKIVPWEKITVSFDDFPYYVEEETKSRLVECVAPILKCGELRKFLARLGSPSRITLLRSIPGSELYRERLVRALAREMQVPLLRLDEDHGCADEDGEDDSDDGDEVYEQNNNRTPKLKKGDRVMYLKRNFSFEEANGRILSYGQRGEVYEVKGYTVAVAFNIFGLRKKKADKDEQSPDILRQALLVWLNVKDVRLVVGRSQARLVDCCIAMEVLCQVLQPQQRAIVYFADSFLWPNQSDYEDYLLLRYIFDQLPEGVAILCPENYSRDESKQEAAKAVQFPSYVLINNAKDKLFSNAICLKSPKDKDLKTVISEANLQTMNKVLKHHNLSCSNMDHLDIDYMILERKKVEKIVGWAVNHYLTSCPVNEEKLHIPYESIKLAISRFMEEEDPQEEWIASVVVRSEDIGVKFDDVGVLENVKNVLYKTVILPMRRPELFSHGNTLRFCKGILLFGPPGTGKTLVAKALAAESGANFINITAAAFTSMSFKALFSYSSKLAPVIIYLDEVDSFPGACGPDICDRNQLTDFMTAWDNWNSKECQRVLLIAATNRPFDLDESVICHLPRRIYIGLPDVESRSKRLKIFLDKENLEPGFSFDQLAEATEGYSLMDLKNLCLDAVYGPIEEFLEKESKGKASDGVPALRPLNLSDFIRSKSKVRPSVAESASRLREWNEKYGEGEGL